MNIKTNFLLTCQNAFLSAGTNNLNLINIFTNINADKFPFVYGRFALVANIDVDTPGQHTLNTVVSGPDGKVLAKTALPVKVNGPNFQVIANFENMHFSAPGTYELKVDVDGVPVGTKALKVNMVVNPKNQTKNVA